MSTISLRHIVDALDQGANGVMLKSADELTPALEMAFKSDLPTVIQAQMENAPTPTPGHWNINDIYRKAE